jgi:beta-1,4-mannosyl-glycoprotein beta-1,4-N-acetylglucosaminyltransferase
MKFIDCFMYYDEDMILDLRLNMLDKFVSYFVICEANFNHNGSKRELKFDIKKFSKFKSKIIYLPLNFQPNKIKRINEMDSQLIKNSKILDNALLRDNFQRNYLQNKIKDFHEDDLIIISDVDEIPNLDKFTYKSKITIFEQKMFYYKLNLLHENFKWYGSKITKKKHLLSPQWLRNIKSKKYPLWRIDILLSKKKYNNINFIKDGGWHFTNIKSPKDIHFKLSNFAHHLEYEESNLKIEDLEKMIKERKISYNHSLDKKGNKWNSSISLKKVNDEFLPDYLNKNKSKYKIWFD